MPKDTNFYLLVVVARMQDRLCILMARLVFGSDIPGIWTTFFLGNHKRKYLINDGVNRTTVRGTPEGEGQRQMREVRPKGEAPQES